MAMTGLDIVELSVLPKACEPIVMPVGFGAVKVLPRWNELDEVSRWRLKYRQHMGDDDPDPDLEDSNQPWMELELRSFTRELPLADLASGVPHYFKVAIETPEGWSDWSMAVTIVPPAPSLPGKCAAVYAIVQGLSSALIRWTRPVDFSLKTPAAHVFCYKIRVTWAAGKDEDPNMCEQEIFIEEDTDQYEVGELRPLTHYQFQVAGANISGWGEYSDPSPPITVVPPVPMTLGPPTLRRATHHSVVIQWQHPPPSDVAVDSFRFRYTACNSWQKDVTEIQDVAANLSQYVIEGLRPGQIYVFQVRALNRFGIGLWSDSSVPIRTLDGKSPSKISQLTAPNVYRSFITLQWAPAEENGYPVQSHLLRYSHTPNMEHPVELVPAVERKDGLYRCDIRHLRKFKYYFQVAAINEMGMGEWSDAAILDMSGAPDTLQLKDETRKLALKVS